MTLKDILLALLIAFIWGLNYVAMKVTAMEMPGFLSAALRFALTALFLIPVARKPDISFKKLYYISLISGAYIGLIYYSMHLGIDTCLGVIIMQLNAPLTILIARIILKETFTKESIVGMGISLVGVIIVVGAPSSVGNSYSLFIMLLAALCCAGFSVKSKEVSQIEPLNLIFWTHLIAAPHLLIVSSILEVNPLEYIHNFSSNFWVCLLYSILFSCIFGIAARIYLLRKYEVHKVVTFNLLVPFFGVSSSMLFEHHIPSWHILVGGVVIMIGITVSQTKISIFRELVHENN